MIIWISCDKAFDKKLIKQLIKHQVFMIKGCLALGVIHFTHTIRSPMSRENMKCRNEAHIFCQFLQALLRRLPMAHTNWLRYTRVRGPVWHPCWTHVQQMSHGPSTASSPLHPASAELRRFGFQYVPSPKPILPDIWLYGCS